MINRMLNNKPQVIALFMLVFAALPIQAAEPLANSSNAVTMTAYVKVILGLLFVIGLFLLSTWLFKRFGNGPMLARGQMKIVDGLHISNKERLVLVELQGKQLLLAITPGRITKLDTLYGELGEAGVDDAAYKLVQASAEQSRA